MNKKFVLIVFLAAVVMSFAAGFIFKDVIPTSLFQTGQDPFNEITSILDDYYYYDINDAAKLESYVSQLDAIVEAYSRYFNDPYTRIDAYPLSQSYTTDYIGMGITFYFDGLIPVVSYVYYEAPAYQKLYPGDVLMGIKGEETTLFEDLASTDEVLSLLRGNQFDEKTFIVRNADFMTREETVIYDYIPITNVEVKQFNDTFISYIRIREFTPYVDADNPGTAQAFKDAIEYLEEHGLDERGTLIIDLRDNPGGAVSALHNLNFPNYPSGIIQQLIPYDSDYPAFQMTDYEGKITTFRGGLSEPKSYDIAVLVNQYSASASEVLAASLQQQGYLVYGQETFGKYVYQNQYPLTQINDIEYVLVYTEGIWTYKEGVTVLEDPIDVQSIDAHPYHEIDALVYDGLMQYDDVNQSLIPFQQFLNIYFDADIREDGYFDLETETLLREFQTEFDVAINGRLTYETFKVIYDLYNQYTQDLLYDTQLNALVDVLS